MTITQDRMRTTLVSPSYNAPPSVGPRRPRRRRKRSVTLIVGLHCDDHLLLSADSGVYDDQEDAVVLSEKLEYGGPFAWGFSGYETLGLQFQEWMRTEHARLAGLGNWTELEKELTASLARINREPLQELQTTGQVPFNRFAHGIVAGFVGGDGVLIRLDAGSVSQIVTTPGKLIALGRDDLAANAHSAMRNDDTWTPDQVGLQRLMELAITFGHDDNLRQPVRMLKVTQRGSEDVSRKRFWKRLP
jgi:hypothetical protein